MGHGGAAERRCSGVGGDCGQQSGWRVDWRRKPWKVRAALLREDGAGEHPAPKEAGRRETR